MWKCGLNNNAYLDGWFPHDSFKEESRCPNLFMYVGYFADSTWKNITDVCGTVITKHNLCPYLYTDT